MPWRRGASPSAISGEIQRHSGGCGYASHFAHMRRLRRCKFSRPPKKRCPQFDLFACARQHLLCAAHSGKRCLPRQMADHL